MQHDTEMTRKTLKAKKRKIAPKKATKVERKLVLVGTYKEGQLAWIGEHLLYNYPVREGDKFDAALGKVSELWLYAGTKAKRHCYEAKFGEIPAGDITKQETHDITDTQKGEIKWRLSA